MQRTLEELVALRVREIECRQRMIEALRPLHREARWREWGFHTFPQFCETELGYSKPAMREVLVALGEILPTDHLNSPDPETQDRIERLKEWRKQRAQREGRAAFRVFSNRTLLMIARDQPRTVSDLLAVRGIGEYKARVYGEDIIAQISAARS